MRIIWEQINSTSVRALRTVENEYDSLSANDVYPVQDWCEQNQIGVRMSFDTFKFKSESDKFLFLLRWS